MDTRSLGRFSTQTLSSLSTARPVTPPIFHLLGSGLGQVGSTLNFGTAGDCAPTRVQVANMASPTSPAIVRALPRTFMTCLLATLYPRTYLLNQAIVRCHA